jgi:hypothetical protein
MQKLLFAIGAMFTLDACSTVHVPASPSSPRSQPDTTTINLNSSSWTPRITAGTRQYFIRDSSTVSINNDTTSRALPINSRMIYSISVTNVGDSFMLTTHIDSLTVSTQAQIKSSSDTGRVSELRTSLSKQGRLTTNHDYTTITCSGASTTTVSRIGELIISFPATHLKVGDKWADTTSSASCHGKIPLIQQAIREYEILDLSSCLQRDAVKVRRTISDTFNGASADTNNHLSATGSGTASSILCLQRENGALIESNGQSRSDLIVITSRGSFPFTQNVNTHIELR